LLYIGVIVELFDRRVGVRHRRSPCTQPDDCHPPETYIRRCGPANRPSQFEYPEFQALLSSLQIDSRSMFLTVELQIPRIGAWSAQILVRVRHAVDTRLRPRQRIRVGLGPVCFVFSGIGLCETGPNLSYTHLNMASAID